MAVSLCIHGHFYQPPREDPWLGVVLTEGSAAPMRHWNERILRESYAPLAWARRQDPEGRITDILNSYAWINFNAGPTLLRWLRSAAPAVLARMREGDAQSVRRWGQGNAIAQVYHHVIMPLATPEERELETRWAMDDFRFHFGREPLGMWLPECAVDAASLETLAAHGIRFVILAPRQAKAVLVDGTEHPVDENSLDVGRAYRVALPSGASMTVVFYHGGISQGIAFEGLLRNGETFWQRIAGEARALPFAGEHSPLLAVATDGETYGHHFVFGEMALAHILAQGYARRDDIRLTNLAAYIEANPPELEVVLHDSSSWSCVHGVERWRSDCGCSNNGNPAWNQKWRGPLREALNVMRQGVVDYFAIAGKECFTDPGAALADYGKVLANPNMAGEFADTWFRNGGAIHDRAWKMLAMQEESLAAFASCAWFFDDIARIEPENALTFSLKAMELLKETGGPDLRPDMLNLLEKAFSNVPGAGTGADIFLREVLPRRDDAATLCLLAWIFLDSRGVLPESGQSAGYIWPEVFVSLLPEQSYADGMRSGSAVIRIKHERFGTRWRWRIRPPSRLQENAPLLPLSDCSITVRREDRDGEPEITRRVRDLSRPMRDYVLSHFLENWEYKNRQELLAVAAHAVSLTEPWLDGRQDVPMPEFWVGFIPYLLVQGMFNDAVTDGQRVQMTKIFSLHLSNRAKALARHLITRAFLFALRETEGAQRAGLDSIWELATPESAGMGQSAAAPEDADGMKHSPHHPVPAVCLSSDARFADTQGIGQKGHGYMISHLPDDDPTLAEWARRVKIMLADMDWWAVQNRLWEYGTENFPLLAKELGFR